MFAPAYYPRASPPQSFRTAPPAFGATNTGFAVPYGPPPGRPVAYSPSMVSQGAPRTIQRNPQPAASSGFVSQGYGLTPPVGGQRLVGSAAVPAGPYVGSAAVPVGPCVGSASVPAGSASVPTWALPGSGQVRQTGGLSASMRAMPDGLSQAQVASMRAMPDGLSQTFRRMQAGGYNPVAASRGPQQARPSPVQPSRTPPAPAPRAMLAHFGGSGATTPITPMAQPPPAWQPQSSAQQAQGARQRVVSPRVQPPSAALPKRTLDLSCKSVPQAKSSENALPWQELTAKPELKILPGAGQSPTPCRALEALRERNALQPEQSPSASPPSTCAAKRPPAFTQAPALTECPPARAPRSPRQLEFRNLDGGAQTATPAGRSAGPHMDFSVNNGTDFGAVPLASPAPIASLTPIASPMPVANAYCLADADRVAISTDPSSLGGAWTAEEAPPLPRELAMEAPYSAREVVDCSADLPCMTFAITNKHPMVIPEEKTFILSCLEAFAVIVGREGGFNQYVLKDDCDARIELVGKPEDCEDEMTPEEVLRKSCETMVQQTARCGCDSVTVQLGGIVSMGMKKLVKVAIKCEDFENETQQISICWDWDVKLEKMSCHAEA